MPLYLYGIRMPWRLDEFIRWRKNRMKVMSSNKHELAQLYNGPLTGTTWVGQYLKHSPCDTHPDHWTSFINFFHLLRAYPWRWILLLGLLENPVLYIICRMLIGKGQKSWHMPSKYHGIHSECGIVILLQLCVCVQPTYIYFSSGVS